MIKDYSQLIAMAVARKDFREACHLRDEAERNGVEVVVGGDEPRTIADIDAEAEQQIGISISDLYKRMKAEMENNDRA